MVLSTGGPARLVVTKREVFIQNKAANVAPFLQRTLVGGGGSELSGALSVYVCAPDVCVCVCVCVCVLLPFDFQYPRGSEASLGAEEGRGMQITPYNAESKNSMHLPLTCNV